MEPLMIARLIVVLLAALPMAAASLWAMYFDHFPQRSLRQIAALLATLIVFFGTAILQRFIYNVVGHANISDRFPEKIFIAQGAVSLGLLMWILYKKEIKSRF